MTTTPKPDVRNLGRHVKWGDHTMTTGHNVCLATALLAEAPTMDLSEDHPYWEIPDDLRRGMHWDRGLERFTARGEIARVLRDEHGWTVWLDSREMKIGTIYYPRMCYEVCPPQRPKVTQVPAREVAKRLIDGERVVVDGLGEVEILWNATDDEVLFLDSPLASERFPWDSTVPVIEDGDQ